VQCQTHGYLPKFPAVEHYHSLSGTKLYCLVWTACLRLTPYECCLLQVTLWCRRRAVGVMQSLLDKISGATATAAVQQVSAVTAVSQWYALIDGAHSPPLCRRVQHITLTLSLTLTNPILITVTQFEQLAQNFYPDRQPFTIYIPVPPVSVSPTLAV